jgi:RHS repeat-associated protein
VSGQTVIYNLRFPGQYYLAESGLVQNYFRDFDPATGRYLEPDRLGLFGGSFSTYSYANNNPISRIDPLGLWSFQIGLYGGFGGAVIIGQDPSTGAWFYGGRIGIGLDAGISFDPNGKRPGAEKKSACGDEGAGTTVGTFGDYGVNAGPLQYPIEQFGGGVDITSGQPYSEGPTLGSPAFTLGNGKGFDVGGSFGIQVIGHN